MKTHTAKRRGTGLGMRTVTGNSATTYLIYQTGRGGYHAFVEVEAKEVAEDCGIPRSGTTQQMWRKIWGKNSN